VECVTQHEPSGGINDLRALFDDTEPITQPQSFEPRDPSPAENRPKRRRPIVRLVVLLVVAALVATYVALTLATPVGATAGSSTPPVVTGPSAASIAVPSAKESAVSVSGADGYLPDGILASSGGNHALPMASISKIVTALVVLNAKPLGASGTGPIIHFTRADTELYEKYFALNATIAPMPIGTTMSEYDAIETMLVPSACNYAEALAEWAYGSDSAFLYATRVWLKAHGLTGTTILEPTGLDARNTSTPADLIKIGQLAMANHALATIVAKTHVDGVPSLSNFLNTNDLLGVDGVDGIKTGTLDSAGSDLLFSATEAVGLPNPITITGVLLGGNTRASVDADARSLITSITSGFSTLQLATKGQVVGTYTTPWGAKASMVLGKTASLLVWSKPNIATSITTDPLKNGRSGEVVGSVTYVVGKTTIKIPVLLQGGIKPPSAFWRLTHPFQVLGH
jgi:D-alanyl-D-alanine carboxypeptidase (penicillin-binding protein 5/6)